MIAFKKGLSLKPPTMKMKSTPEGCFDLAAFTSSSTLEVIFSNKSTKNPFIISGGKSIEDAPHYLIENSSSLWVVFQTLMRSFSFFADSSSPR